MKDRSEDFVDQLGHYLVRAGLTQQELANKIGKHWNTIVNWMNRTSWPESRGQVLRIADELSLSQEERKAFIQAARFSLERWPTEVWNVPQLRDIFFTGRDDVFQSLRQFLMPGSAMALTQAISGLGGIGKTHIAVEYAYRFHQYYKAVLWLQADSWEVLASECMKAADELGLPERKETDLAIAGVQRWLRKHSHWLLILDNVENPQEILPKFVPTGHQGSVLVTTRVRNVEPLAQTQVLPMMPEQEGVLFLLRRTKKIASTVGLEQANSTQRDEALQIWQLMDGLPLALDQAGAYILETGCSFLAYLEKYTSRRAELLDRRGNRFIGHEASVAATFSLAFERVEALNPLAADILRICSQLYNEAIPEEIFQEGAEHLGPHLATEKDYWDIAIGMLQDYSLVQRNTDMETLALHRLVQAVLQNILSEQEHKQWTERVVAALNAIFPEMEQVTWSRGQRLVSHALLSANHTVFWEQGNLDLASLLFKTARYLYERGQYTDSEPLYQRALRIREQVLGPEHFDVAHSLNRLALLYFEQGKYAEAEPLLQRALHIWEQNQEPEHPDIAYPLHNLALLYFKQGRYVETEPLYQRALRIREQVLGSEHPDVAYSLNGLGELYREQGRYAEAELLFQRALRIWEQSLGAEHPDVAYPLNNLALLYILQGNFTEAEPLYLRALTIRKQALGLQHPKTVETQRLYIILVQEMGLQDEDALSELPHPKQARAEEQ